LQGPDPPPRDRLDHGIGRAGKWKPNSRRV
jgi:hypothetical protein